MRTTWQKIICVLLAVVLLTETACMTADAANFYQLNTHWKAVTASRAEQMYASGEDFILYCYRATCSNCQTIGSRLVTEWMDDYGADVCGISIDGVGGIPDFVFGGVKKSRTLPFVAFVRDGQVLAYSKEGTLDAYMQTLQEAFLLYQKGGPVQNRLTVVTLPDVTRYFVGAQADLTGLTLQAAYTDGTTQTVTDGYTFTGFSTETPGRKTITVLYDGMQTSFDIHVDTPGGAPAVRILPPEPAEIRFSETLTLAADTDNMPDDAHIEWRCGVKHASAVRTQTGTGNTFTVTAQGVSQTVTVQAQIVAADGSVLAVAQQPVRFDNGWHSRLLSLQKSLHLAYENTVGFLLRIAAILTP